MKSVRITYDQEGDILYVTFGQPTAAVGYQLSDQLLLRVDPQTQSAAGLTIFNFSVHARTAIEIPLPGVDKDQETKIHLLKLFHSPPLTHFLQIVDRKEGTHAVLLRPSLQEAVAA